jgi:hypothetical protein
MFLTLPPYRHLWANCLDNVGSLTSHNPIGLQGLLWDTFTFIITEVWLERINMDFGYSQSPVYRTFSFDCQKCSKNSVYIRNIVVFNRIMAYLHTSLFTTDNDMAQKKPTIDNINTIARFSHQDTSMLNVRIFSETCVCVCVCVYARTHAHRYTSARADCSMDLLNSLNNLWLHF